MSWSNCYNQFTVVLAVFSVSLLILNTYGVSKPAESLDTTGISSIVSNYHTRTLEVKDAKSRLIQLSKDADEMQSSQLIRELFDLIHRSFIHTQSYRLKPWDNWVLWLQSLITSDDFLKNALIDTQDATLLWNRGGGFCHQAAWIFVEYSRKFGFEAHLIRLPGHYLAEVEIAPGKWWLADTDLGILWEQSADSVFTTNSSTDISQQLMNIGYKKELAEKMATIYKSGRTKTRKRNYLYSKTLYDDEKQAQLLSWILPLFGLLPWLVHRLRKKVFQTHPHT